MSRKNQCHLRCGLRNIKTDVSINYIKYATKVLGIMNVQFFPLIEKIAVTKAKKKTRFKRDSF